MEFSAVLWMLDSLFPQPCPVSSKNMPPSNKSEIFTLPLKLSMLS
jgi:hypothetical protein